MCSTCPASRVDRLDSLRFPCAAPCHRSQCGLVLLPSPSRHPLSNASSEVLRPHGTPAYALIRPRPNPPSPLFALARPRPCRSSSPSSPVTLTRHRCRLPSPSPSSAVALVRCRRHSAAVGSTTPWPARLPTPRCRPPFFPRVTWHNEIPAVTGDHNGRFRGDKTASTSLNSLLLFELVLALHSLTS